ncbi:CAP-Gly domain-containing linker protein 1-like isoform X2 [Artemia franciscana]|uniref:CAP-Gly domain-containing linker protein 1-like isoform X2 n=1 Tax=Artemia franciscana TaxID=6661 RepID=UPI0032DA21FE
MLKVEKLQSKLTESNSSAIEMRKTIEEKLAVITSLSEETKMLATENDQLKSQISDKTSILEQLKKTLKETGNELKTVESKLKEFENLSRHHADEINKKENELAQVTKEKEVVEDLLASTKEEIQLLKFLTFRKLLEKELANLQKEHDVFRLSNSILEVEFTTLRRSSNSAEEIISNQRKDIGDLKLKMAQFDQVQDLLTDSALKITELEEKMTMAANTEYELKHLRNEYATLETQRESALCALKEASLALEKKSKAEEQCVAYKAQLDSACSRIQELENQVKGVMKLKSEVNDLKLENAEHANSISTLNKNLDDFKARYTSIMNEHQTVLKEKMEIGTQLAEAEYKITGLQEKLISLENRLKENKELLAELQSVKAVVKDLESRAPVSQPNFDVEWVRQENARLTDHSSHLSEKLDSAIKETENLRRVIKESSSEKDVLLKETDQLRLKLQELETARNTDHVKEDLMEKLEESQKELEEANAKVVNLTAQVNSLEDFLKKNEKRVEFATFSEYKAVGPTAVDTSPVRDTIYSRPATTNRTPRRTRCGRVVKHPTRPDM